MSRDGKGGAQVTYGAALDSSVFHVQWTVEYEQGAPLVTHHTVTPSTHQVQKVSGPELRPTNVVWHTADGTRPRFEMERPYGTEHGRDARRLACRVWLDVDGTGSHRLPQTFVPWAFVMSDPVSKEARSVDY